MPFDELQLLILRIPNGQNEPPVFRQLPAQRLRHSRRRRGNQDGIERSQLWQAQRAVAAVNMHISVPEPFQPGGNRGRKFGAGFHRENCLGEQRKNRRLIPTTGANFQNSLSPSEGQSCGHRCNDVWLRNGLAFSNRQRTIVIRPRATFVWNKLFAPNRCHGRKHSRIRNAAPPQLLFHHFGALQSKFVGTAIAAPGLAAAVLTKHFHPVLVKEETISSRFLSQLEARK